MLSPAFTYALAGGTPNCQRGTSIARTLEILRTTGALPLEEFIFDGNACTREATTDEMSRAAHWRIKGWSRVDGNDLAAVKGQLARGRPVIFAMAVGPKFQGHRGAGVLSALDTGPGLDGHAMVLIGYDDARNAFRLQNSHGQDWGDNGYAWISYAAWQQAVFDKRGFVIE
jgi:C1A family cysteine protease